MNAEAAVRAAIPADVAGLLRKIHQTGFAAYVVGGAVRDVIAGRQPVDWDLATDATPDALRAHFPDARYENRFGTVGIPTDNEIVREVTTFRIDAPSSDARRPDSVAFVDDISADLARRDFTINAIAFGLSRSAASGADPIAEGRLVDPHGGAGDIAAKLLRAVGDPDERFREDALRMLRAARFAARFDLEIDPSTAAAIRRDAGLAITLSGERIGAEIEGLLVAPHADRGIHILHELGLLAAIAPHLDAAWSDDLPRRVVSVDSDPTSRLWALLTPLSDEDVVKALLTAWRRPRATISAVHDARHIDEMLVRTLADAQHHSTSDLRIDAAKISGDPREAARQLRRRIATTVGSSRDGSDRGAATLLAALEAADAAGAPALPADLAISGDDLLRDLGGVPGPWLQPILETLLREAARGAIENAPAPLLARARALHEGGARR